jgi:transcriptional regulator with XRE-family HTH domain
MKYRNERIRELREKLGITQIDLAAKVGVTQAAISLIELGKSENPAVDTAQKIAKVLGVPLEELFPINDTAA